LEFPDATKDGDITSDKYKRFIVHYRPSEGMYAGGTFRIMFDVSPVPEYPYKPPKVTCLTKVWHPNITLEGRVCHNYLQTDRAFGDGAGWSPAVQMQGLVNAILTMFDDRSDSFNPDDPLNDEAAAQYKNNRDAFATKAREWTREHARQLPIEEWRIASSN
jgi:ubiquitin-protein ligase